jgi:hypothetical protein
MAKCLLNRLHYQVLRIDWTQSFIDRHQPLALILFDDPPHGGWGYAGQRQYRPMETWNIAAAPLPALIIRLCTPQSKARGARRLDDQPMQK